MLEEAQGADDLLLLARGELRYSGELQAFVDAQGDSDFQQAALRVLQA